MRKWCVGKLTIAIAGRYGIQERHLPVWETLSGCEAMANEIMAYSSENGPHKWEEVCEQLAGEAMTRRRRAELLCVNKVRKIDDQLYIRMYNYL